MRLILKFPGVFGLWAAHALCFLLLVLSTVAVSDAQVVGDEAEKTKNASITGTFTRSNVTSDFQAAYSIPSDVENEIVEDLILCRDCGQEISSGSFIGSHRSPDHAVEVKNGTILGELGVLVQKFRNPAGISFDVVTVSNSSCVGRGEWVTEHTWFPGYAWRVCVCPHCLSHKGWMFEPLDNVVAEERTGNRVQPSRPSLTGFYALIVDSLVREDFAESLVITPKALRF